jgi:predicted Fe-Mo cluster-binding NifX family protein
MVPLNHRSIPMHLAGFLRMETVMKVAVPVWNGRVSPVFDVAEHFCVLDVHDGVIKARSDQDIHNDSRVVTLWKLGVDVVICGAVSNQLEAALWVAGIEVIPEICGPVDMVIHAFFRGELAEGDYFSPCHSDRSREISSAADHRKISAIAKDQ